MPWAIAYAVVVPLFIVVILMAIVLALAEPAISDFANSITTLFRVVTISLRILAIYVLRNELAESPIHISTSGLMTFFFGSIYFQYHLNDYVLSEERRPPPDGTLELS